MEAYDPDHGLMLRIGQKDIEAYRELIGKHLNKGIKVAERMLGNRQDAEDVMQETCLKVWDEAERWKPKAKFSTWLYRVIFNACLDHKRKIVPFSGVEEVETLVDESPAADDVLIAGQRAKAVQRALQKLAERQRAAMILSYYENISNQDAADALEMNLGAFQQLLFRAKQNLKDELKEYLVEYVK